MTQQDPHHVIVIGASAGGFHSIVELLAQITEEMNAAVFIVLHTPNLTYSDLIIQRLQRNTVFTCKMAEHEESIQSKHVYLAVPDRHLILKKGQMLLGQGPVENRWRPSIDVLFRSAAVAYDGAVIGVILTGLLEDGVSGMQFIQRCGGTTIIQDPEEAEYPDMPRAVMRYMNVDYCTSLQRIAVILQEKTKNGVNVGLPIPSEVLKEAEVAERVAIGIENAESIGDERSAYSCPDCGGALWEINYGGMKRFRCHTGHMYTSDELLEGKRKELETTFWVALRILEERRNLLNKMAEEEEGKGWVRSAANKKERAKELEVHINRIKQVLFESTDDPEPTRLQMDGK